MNSIYNLSITVVNLQIDASLKTLSWVHLLVKVLICYSLLGLQVFFSNSKLNKSPTHVPIGLSNFDYSNMLHKLLIVFHLLNNLSSCCYWKFQMVSFSPLIVSNLISMICLDSS